MAWVVSDLEAAALRFSRSMGVGPFLVSRHIPLNDYRYRGSPAQVDFSIAVAQAGAVQIELIEQHDEQPSVYRDLFASGAEGLHHVAFIVPDVAAEIARYSALGFDLATSGRFGDAEFAYVDTASATGHMTEILPDHPTIHSFFGAVRRAAEEWDGVDPVREMR
jgi:hypothetical protein